LQHLDSQRAYFVPNFASLGTSENPWLGDPKFRKNPALREATGFDPLAVPLLRVWLGRLALPVEAVCADSAYDADALLRFVVEDLPAQPVVALAAQRSGHSDQLAFIRTFVANLTNSDSEKQVL
jgi:hypothetical protein